MTVISDSLKELRNQLSPLKKQWPAIAVKAGVSARTIVNIMNPDYKPSLTTLSKLQKAMEPKRKRGGRS